MNRLMLTGMHVSALNFRSLVSSGREKSIPQQHVHLFKASSVNLCVLSLSAVERVRQ